MSQPLNPNFRCPAAVARFLLVVAVGLTVDLWSKWLAFEKLQISRTQYPDGSVVASSRIYDFIPGWLRFEVTVNQGAVFGIGQGQRLIFLLVSAAAVAFLFYLFLSSKPGQWFYQIVLGMLLAGVLGNVYDRVRFGFVRDMIHALPGWPNPLRGIFPGWQFVFPWIFNVADSLLCVGVVLMLAYTLVAPNRDGARERDNESPEDSRRARADSSGT
jgi:signal peptidase II